MKKKASKIFLEAQVRIPDHVHEQFISAIEEQFKNAISWDELYAHPGVDAYIRAALVRELEQFAAGLDAWNLIDTGKLEKILKPELLALAKKQQEELVVWVREQEEAKKVNKIEEARLRKEGRSLVVPLKDSNRAEAILQAAGIDVKLLP